MLAWVFVSLALPAVAIGFFLFGTWRERARLGAQLREARLRALGWQALQPHWLWRSDEAHRVVQWQGPGEAAVAGASAVAGPEPAGLEPHLAARRPFRGARVSAADGSTWLIDGEPVTDGDAAFAGFVGSARPESRDADPDGLAAAAITPLLGALPGAAVLATTAEPAPGVDATTLVPGDWRVSRSNAPARAAWPALVPGTPLEDWLGTLPAAVARAVGSLAIGQTAEADGWRLVRFAVAPGTSALLVARAAAPGGEAEAFGPTLSHDLRAPIRVVEGFTRIVKEDYGAGLDRVANDHLDRVLGAAARMNLMIDALLTLSRLSSQPLARQPVDLSQLAQFVVDDLRRGAPERQVEIAIEPGLQAHGDPTLLRLVLENLIGNAWKYTARAARPSIRLARGEHGGRPTFEVADNGAGFDMRSADRLFGLFQRLHSANDFAGHGVGLASVKRIVQRHGGEIWATAEPGRGATFSFTLG